MGKHITWRDDAFYERYGKKKLSVPYISTCVDISIHCISSLPALLRENWLVLERIARARSICLLPKFYRSRFLFYVLLSLRFSRHIISRDPITARIRGAPRDNGDTRSRMNFFNFIAESCSARRLADSRIDIQRNAAAVKPRIRRGERRERTRPPSVAKLRRFKAQVGSWSWDEGYRVRSVEGEREG